MEAASDTKAEVYHTPRNRRFSPLREEEEKEQEGKQKERVGDSDEEVDELNNLSWEDDTLYLHRTDVLWSVIQSTVETFQTLKSQLDHLVSKTRDSTVPVERFEEKEQKSLLSKIPIHSDVRRDILELQEQTTAGAILLESLTTIQDTTRFDTLTIPASSHHLFILDESRIERETLLAEQQRKISELQAERSRLSASNSQLLTAMNRYREQYTYLSDRMTVLEKKYFQERFQNHAPTPSATNGTVSPSKEELLKAKEQAMVVAYHKSEAEEKIKQKQEEFREKLTEKTLTYRAELKELKKQLEKSEAENLKLKLEIKRMENETAERDKRDQVRERRDNRSPLLQFARPMNFGRTSMSPGSSPARRTVTGATPNRSKRTPRTESTPPGRMTGEMHKTPVATDRKGTASARRQLSFS